MGRNRKFNKLIPKHIDQKKIPDGVYFDSSGKGRWYVSWKENSIGDNGKPTKRQVKRTIAPSTATLAELYKAIQEWQKPQEKTFRWLCDRFFDSSQFDDLKSSTRREYGIYLKKLYEIETKNRVPIPLNPLTVWNQYLVQRIVDTISTDRGPTAAKHTHSFVRRVFKWGRTRGLVDHQPATGIELPKLKPSQKLPDPEAYEAVKQYAKNEDPVWFIIMELEYLCRMRGIEIRQMSDRHITEAGVHVERAKGSKDNIVAWNDRLTSAVEQAKQRRASIWEKRKIASPIDKSKWPLLVNTKGYRMTEAGYRTAWNRFITRAIEAKVITEEQRFSPHDLKRKGVTETVGTRADKQDASGHRSESMLDIYDKSVQLVRPAGE